MFRNLTEFRRVNVQTPSTGALGDKPLHSINFTESTLLLQFWKNNPDSSAGNHQTGRESRRTRRIWLKECVLHQSSQIAN